MSNEDCRLLEVLINLLSKSHSPFKQDPTLDRTCHYILRKFFVVDEGKDYCSLENVPGNGTLHNIDSEFNSHSISHRIKLVTHSQGQRTTRPCSTKYFLPFFHVKLTCCFINLVICHSLTLVHYDWSTFVGY